MNRYFILFSIALLIAAPAFAQDGERVDITNFESDADAGISVDGSTIVFSMVDDPNYDDVPRHEGTYALFGEYDTSQGAWTQTTINLPNPVDLTGMREFHFWIYFFEDATPHQDGGYRMRLTLPNGHVMDEPAVDTAGEWVHVTAPIDRTSSNNELSSFSNFSIIWMPGANNNATGGFYIDEIYATRPANTPGVQEELVYGFNEADPDTGYPVGWTIREDEAVGMSIGDGEVEPSEGSNYLVSIMPGGWVRPLETISAKDDFDEWEKVIDISVDVQMSEGFSAGWHNFELVIESSSGGYQSMGIRNGNVTGEWRKVTWGVDMTPHLPALEDPNGWMNFSFVTQTADETDSSVYIDNFRVGLPTTYVVGERTISDSIFSGGESFDVNVTVTAEGEVQDYPVEENIPEGWTVSDISDDGVSENGSVTWALDLNNETKTVSYTVTAPIDPTESGVFSGTVGGLDTRGQDKIVLIYSKLWDLRVETPYASNDVVLDGVINEDEYAGAFDYYFDHDTSDGNEAPGVHIFGNEYPANEENVTFYVFHDDESVYVACDITDMTLAFNENEEEAWNDDSVEVFFDGNMSRTDDREDGPLGIQCTVVGDGHLIGGNNAPTPIEADGYFYSEDGSVWNYGARAKEDGTGYVVEYQFDKAQILDPDDREILGFEILMNASEPGAGERTGKWGFYSTLSDDTIIEAHQDERGWALMELLPGESSVSDWALF